MVAHPNPYFSHVRPLSDSAQITEIRAFFDPTCDSILAWFLWYDKNRDYFWISYAQCNEGVTHTLQCSYSEDAECMILNADYEKEHVQ